ncbi:GxxExxY protein [Schaedlerella arabinosiphila]|uniref:GxxExxY protein n=1 Tax=Schaedlerella arabinosiphila TaxID=2044587 RepID=UPI0027E3BCED|nr:GxxExxY protein [Schaedlerella arabinosiphila]
MVDYCGEQFIVETKIWRGLARHQQGEEQVFEYLKHHHLDKGYILTFNFNKKKEIGVKEVPHRDKILIEAVV